MSKLEQTNWDLQLEEKYKMPLKMRLKQTEFY